MFKMNSIKLLMLSCIVLTSLVGCREDKKNDDVVTDCSLVTWAYEGETGPENWADLCTEHADCGQQNQSPVNITGVVNDPSLSAINTSYTSTKANIVNNGHTIQFNCDSGSSMTVNGTKYDLLQFHYHGLSEHKVDGNHYPLEVHFVHKATDDNLAVIGVFFEEGEENPLLADFLSKFPTKKGEYTDNNASIDLSSLLPSNMSYYNYNGSLTTPPCSEVVNWYVLKNTVTASKNQLSEFQSILHSNYRPVQDLNGRSIKMFTE